MLASELANMHSKCSTESVETTGNIAFGNFTGGGLLLMCWSWERGVLEGKPVRLAGLQRTTCAQAMFFPSLPPSLWVQSKQFATFTVSVFVGNVVWACVCWKCGLGIVLVQSVSATRFRNVFWLLLVGNLMRPHGPN